MTYKPGTSTIRESVAVSFCDKILQQNCLVNIYDPLAEKFPKRWGNNAKRFSSALKSLEDTEALIIFNQSEEYRNVFLELSKAQLSKICVFDINGFYKDLIINKVKKYYQLG